MKKALKITNITIYAIWAIWTAFACVSYAVAWATSPSYAHLRMGEEMAFVNFVVNALFIVNLSADALCKIANRKAKTSD